MAKIAIIGGGIIGTTAAFYLSNSTHDITLFDEPTGQATKASAGIICPWLSKRRNKKWYTLAKDGAAFYTKLTQDLTLDESIYQKSGALIIRPEEKLPDLYELANQRKQDAPEIGEIKLLTALETTKLCPVLNEQSGLYISGGAKLNGAEYLEHVRKVCKDNGVTILEDRVTVQKNSSQWIVKNESFLDTFDFILCTNGPHLKDLLAPLGFVIDVKPQKGQLLSFQTSLQTNNWPVVMLDGEADFIPFQNGEVLLGATHENDAEWDLTPTSEAFDKLTAETKKFFQNSTWITDSLSEIKVGTRAYTSDFAPFFGPISDGSTLLVASGLGSSGLTTGPYIGYLLAESLLTNHWSTEKYQKPMSHYVQQTPLI